MLKKIFYFAVLILITNYVFAANIELWLTKKAGLPNNVDTIRVYGRSLGAPVKLRAFGMSFLYKSSEANFDGIDYNNMENVLNLKVNQLNLLNLADTEFYNYDKRQQYNNEVYDKRINLDGGAENANLLTNDPKGILLYEVYMRRTGIDNNYVRLELDTIAPAYLREDPTYNGPYEFQNDHYNYFYDESGDQLTMSAKYYNKTVASPYFVITPQQFVPIGTTLTFTDQSSNTVSREWTFESGTPSSTVGEGPHNITYKTEGLFMATLTVNKGLEDEASYSDYLYVYTLQCIWWGYEDTNWNNGNNWDCKHPPTFTDEAIIYGIDQGALNNPILDSGADGQAKNLTIFPSAIVNILNNKKITISNE